MASHAIRWAVGGLLYGGLELLYRGRTHWTMLLLAALLCVPLDLANEHIPWEWPLSVSYTHLTLPTSLVV